MPRIKLPNGKIVFSEKDIPDDQIEEFIAFHMEAEEPIKTEPSRLEQSVTSRKESNWYDPLTKPILVEENRPIWDKTIDMMPDFLKPVYRGTQGIMESMTGSPVDLAATLLTAGAQGAASKGYSALSKGLGWLGRGASVPVVAEGGERLLDPESTLPQRGLGALELGLGMAGVAQPIGPRARPKFDPLNPQTTQAFEILDSTGRPVSSAVPENLFEVTNPDLSTRGIVPKFPGNKAVEDISGPTFPITKSSGRPKDEISVYTGQGAEIIPPPKSVSPSEVIPIESGPKPTTELGKKAKLSTEILNFNRAIQTAYDLSFPFRQGLGLIHTKGWWTSWGSMVKSYGSEAAYRGLIESIEQRPNFIRPVSGNKTLPSFAERSGLKLTDLAHLTNREEAIMSTWAEKIPGVRASNRAYTAFANKLRADNFDALIQSAEKAGLDPRNNPELAKGIADFINNASGRGSLGKLEPIAVHLNNVLFSPRLIASRLQMMNPQNYLLTDPMIRKEYLKSVVAMTTAWMTIGQMGKLVGGEFNLENPTSADFGKIKIGDTRLDPGGGFLQYVTLISRFINQGRTSSTSGKFTEYGKGYGASTSFDEAVDFGFNKLSPVPRFVASPFRAEEYKPFNLGDETMRMFMPILWQDLIEIMQEDPSLLPIAGAASMVGIGSNIYDERGKSPKMFPTIPNKLFGTKFGDITFPR